MNKIYKAISSGRFYQILKQTYGYGFYPVSEGSESEYSDSTPTLKEAYRLIEYQEHAFVMNDEKEQAKWRKNETK